MARCEMAWLSPIGEVMPRAGMAVFKARGTVANQAYLPGGTYYDPSKPEDFYHVGLVTSTQPLRVIHATPPRVREDTTLKGWTHIGVLKAVGEEQAMKETRVVSAGTVNLREKPDKHSRLLTVLSKDTAVTAEAVDDVWCHVTVEGREGYCMSEFLSPTEEAAVMLPRALCESLLAALNTAMEDQHA